MTYLMVYDDDKRTPPAAKLLGAVALYERRYGVRPTLVLVNESDKDVSAPEGVAVRTATNVRPNNYWIEHDT